MFVFFFFCFLKTSNAINTFPIIAHYSFKQIITTSNQRRFTQHLLLTNNQKGVNIYFNMMQICVYIHFLFSGCFLASRNVLAFITVCRFSLMNLCKLGRITIFVFLLSTINPFNCSHSFKVTFVTFQSRISFLWKICSVCQENSSRSSTLKIFVMNST